MLFEQLVTEVVQVAQETEASMMVFGLQNDANLSFTTRTNQFVSEILPRLEVDPLADFYD